jgi:predicted AlkP superfamily phosphohydrolase/phosphomutase
MIVFDSPDLGMLQRAIDGGRLPTMARLLQEGAYVALEDLQELVTPCSWPTLVRGSDVAEHGLLCDRQLVPGTYRIAPVAASQARRPPFWRHISDAGLRCTVSGAYGAPLLDDFRGTQLVGWGTHDPFTTKLAGPRSDPPDLVQTLERHVGRRTLRYGLRLPRTRAEYRRYLDDCLRGVEQQTRALIRLLEGTDWDFFFASFSDGHQAGHLLWHLANPDDPDHDAHADPALRDGLMTIYREVDSGIGALLERVPEETAFFVTTPYGLGANHHLERAIDDILAAGGWLVPAGASGASSGSTRLRALRLGRTVAHRTVPTRLRPALGRLVGRERLVDELMLDGIDWERTAAFPLPGDGSAFVRLNLAGREPRGTIAPGDAYDALCAEICDALNELRHAQTGEPVIARAARFDELFGVPAEGPFPDLCVQWQRLPRVSAIRSDRLGTIAVAGDSPLRSVQTAPGFLIGRAPGLPASGSPRLAGSSARLADVAATALAWLGVTPAPEISGRPIRALAPPAAQFAGPVDGPAPRARLAAKDAGR